MSMKRLSTAWLRELQEAACMKGPSGVSHAAGLVSQMTLADLGLLRYRGNAFKLDNNLGAMKTVAAVTLVETSEFSVTVFVVPPGQQLPMHDHPNMSVMMKVLSGTVSLTSYDWVNNRDHYAAVESPLGSEVSSSTTSPGVASTISEGSNFSWGTFQGDDGQAIPVEKGDLFRTGRQHRFGPTKGGMVHSVGWAPEEDNDEEEEEGGAGEASLSEKVAAASGISNKKTRKNNNNNTVTSIREASVFCDLIMPPYTDSRNCTYFTVDAEKTAKKKEEMSVRKKEDDGESAFSFPEENASSEEHKTEQEYVWLKRRDPSWNPSMISFHPCFEGEDGV